MDILYGDYLMANEFNTYYYMKDNPFSVEYAEALIEFLSDIDSDSIWKDYCAMYLGMSV